MFHDQPLDSGGETRHYFVHVPASYECTTAWPLLIDFHGTASGTEADRPEEYYAFDEMIAVADAEKFMVARPRSRFAMFSGYQIYQWDINAGDLRRNSTFASGLVSEIARSYNVDPARVYTSGFSNGTNMAMQLLVDSPDTFHGFAVIAGGIWSRLSLPGFGPTPPRIYATTGYRDYMFGTQRTLLSLLALERFPAEGLFVRETDTGHELYGWHYRELFRWLDRGVRPPTESLAFGWTREAFPGSQGLLELSPTPAGGLLAAATDGAIWRRDANGSWSQVAALAGPPGGAYAPNLTSLCLLASGNGVAVGEGLLARTTDGGLTWTKATPVPPFSSTWFSYSYLNAVGCRGSTVVGGGYQTAVKSDDGGANWVEASMRAWGYAAQVAGVGVSPTGTWVAVGYYDYVGRSTDGLAFAPISTPTPRQWWTEAATGGGGRWVVVGEAGSILLSTDDALSFQEAPSPSREDLYAVAFGDATHAMAVGVHGTALATRDGGATWQDVSTGLDVFLGDVAFVGADRALVVGEHGTVLWYQF